MKYLLNSAVITSPGVFRYELLSPDEARQWAASGEFVSSIGYEETALALSCLLDQTVTVNRVTVKMEPGDQALVFRLVLPPGSPRIDPQDKGRLGEIVQARSFELGLLTRIE